MMSNQNTSQDELSDELKKSITPMPGIETGHAKEIEGRKEGCCCNQKMRTEPPMSTLKNN